MRNWKRWNQTLKMRERRHEERTWKSWIEDTYKAKIKKKKVQRRETYKWDQNEIYSKKRYQVTNGKRGQMKSQTKI